jgi:hypothetical protein
VSEDFAKVGLRINVTASAGFDEVEEDGAVLASFSLADEQPVFLARGCGPDGVLNVVVVDLPRSGSMGASSRKSGSMGQSVRV